MWGLWPAWHSLLGGSGENVALCVVGLKDWSLRKSKDLSIEAISRRLREEYLGFKNADINFFAPPPIPGIGQSNGLALELIATNTNKTPKELAEALNKYLLEINKSGDIEYAFSTFRADTPHLFLDIDSIHNLH